MSLMQTRMRQLQEYLELKRDEAMLSGRLVSSYKDKNKKDVEYDDFKRSLVYHIDTLFHDGKTKIVIRPESSKINLYEKLMRDTEFKGHYECEVKSGNDLEIKMREI